MTKVESDRHAAPRIPRRRGRHPATNIFHYSRRFGASPSTCTAQAPQSAIPQPNFVPVMPSSSRNTHPPELLKFVTE
jgi:hypothetical protein